MAATLELSIDALTDEVQRRVWGTPGYDEQHMSEEELASYLVPNLRVILRCLADGEPQQDAIDAADRIGESRALQGVPVDAVMQAWATAERVVLDHLLVHAERLPGNDLRAAVHRLGDVIVQLTRRSVDAYRRTQEEVTAHYDRLTTDLVAHLTGEQPAEPDEVRRRARTIGVDPTTTYAAVAVYVGTSSEKAGPSAYLRAQRHLLGALGARVPGRVLVGSVDECPLLLVPAPDGSASLRGSLSKALDDQRRPSSMIVSLSESVAQLPGAGPICQEARDALEAGRRLGWQDRVVHFRDVAAEVMLLRSPDIADLLRQRIEPVVARPELLATLRTYLETGLSARETARRLFVHTNTIPYRLRLVEGLLDCTLTDVVEMTNLALGLRAHDLSRGSRAV